VKRLAYWGATPLNRPEDIEVHPFTGEVYICLTNNKEIGDYYGSILKISEHDGDHRSKNFKAEQFLMGGTDLACPDNLVFDNKGNLWVATDISGSKLNRAPYSKFKNNGLFFVPTSGPNAGRAYQVASAPIHAELTGMSFSSNYKTLFLSVQHPGEYSKDLKNLSSRWPRGGSDIPRSSVVQISGENLSKITN
jgi:secreted PhoX family phosphatase